jgi:hypothetical protein
VFDEPVIWTDIYANEDDCQDLPILEARLYDLSDCELGENRRLRIANQTIQIEGEPSWQDG